MPNRIQTLAVIAALFTGPTVACAQHADVLIQDLDSRLTSGTADFDTGAWTLGARTYTQEFDSDFAITDPGWNALGVGSPDLPPGVGALPANTALEWDFLPMKIDGTVANLFYWDGAGSVEFGALPATGYELSLQSKSAGFIPVTGLPELVAGEVIDDTDSIGAIHKHRFFFLDDGDGNLGTDPADGIYLFSLRTRMSGLDRSKPIHFVFGTPGSTSTALTAAQQWMGEVVDDLAPDFSADFEGDLEVDEGDFLVWQEGFGLSGSAALQTAGDADFNDVVNGVDFLAWQRQYGSRLASFAGAISSPLGAFSLAPEPNTFLLAAFGILGFQRFCLRSAKRE